MSQLKKFTKNGKLVFEVIVKIEGQQYKDVAVQMKKNDIHTVPTVSSRDKAHSTPLRLDYAFVSQALSSRIYSYDVLKTKSTDRSSDHYPIMVKVII
jgi:exonuclease III